MLALFTTALLAFHPGLAGDLLGSDVLAIPLAGGRPAENAALSLHGQRDVVAATERGIAGLEIAPPAALPQEVAGPEDGGYHNLYRKFYVSVGGALVSNTTSTLQVKGDSGLGTVIDMESLLNVDDQATVARLDLAYSFSRRHRIDLSYYDIGRGGSTASTTQDIDFGDISIPAGTAVKTDFGTRILKLAYRYNFVAEPRTVIGASFGFHSMGMDISMKANALSLNESFKQELPLPLFGLHGGYALSEKWSLLADAQVLQLNLGDYRGFVSDSRLSLDHDTTSHFGWGLAFNGFTLNGSARGDGGLTADVEYGYQALLLYLRMYL